ncbi:hypothetical protein ACGFX2_39235 [Streptomyces goshikiensis]|uniref:hypothetical protein n=1 Tax=Streptomyces goshikiensis TaxID=1942 RepID=UPI00371DDC65
MRKVDPAPARAAAWLDSTFALLGRSPGAAATPNDGPVMASAALSGGPTTRPR